MEGFAVSELTLFLKENKKKIKNTLYAASESFIDPKTKKPVLWEIRPLLSGEADALRHECTKYKHGQKVEVDETRFNRMMAAKCTVFPDLNDKDLQNSYNVLGAENLIVAMLDIDGEYQKYLAKITEITGYSADNIDNLVKEAKN